MTQRCSNNAPLQPWRALGHPAWIAAVAVLLVNDHVFKPWALAETVTGKVSDFAGLFIFPVLLASLIGARTRTSLHGCAVATALVFAAINVFPSIAIAFDAIASVAMPFVTTTDPTDLVALVAIPVSLRVLQPAMVRQSTPRIAEMFAATLAVFVCSASGSPPCGEGAFDSECAAFEERGRVSILNKSNELHIVRIRPPRSTVEVDCDTVRRNPGAYLFPGVFDVAENWFVQSGQEIPVRRDTFSSQELLDNETGCQFALVENDSAGDFIAFWDASLPVKTFPFDADIPAEVPADPHTIVLDADYSRATSTLHEWRERNDCGERADLCGDDIIGPLAQIPQGATYTWRSVGDDAPYHFARPSLVSGTIADPDDPCELAERADALAWEPPPLGERLVGTVEEGRDGCHEISVFPAGDTDGLLPPERWWVCAPFDALQPLLPEPGATKSIAVAERTELGPLFDGGSDPTLRGQFRELEILVITRVGESAFADSIFLTIGYGRSRALSISPRVEAMPQCRPVEAACSQAARAATVSIPGTTATLSPAEAAVFAPTPGARPVELYLVRAETRPVVDTACDVEAVFPPTIRVDSPEPAYVETVLVERDPTR